MIYYKNSPVRRGYYISAPLALRKQSKLGLRTPHEPEAEPGDPIIDLSKFNTASGSISPKTMTAILPSSSPPGNGISTVMLNSSDDTSGVPIYGWQVGGTAYYYCSAETIKTGPYMSYTFNRNEALVTVDLSGIDFSNLYAFSGVFYACYSLENVLIPSVGSELVDLTSTFRGCDSLVTLDLSGWDTRKVQHMDYTFYSCVNLKTIYVGENWSNESVVNPDGGLTLGGCNKLVGGNGSTMFEPQDSTGILRYQSYYARVDKPGQIGLLTLKG